MQPIAHKERLPEQHTHNVVPQVERTFEHGSVEQDRTRVAEDLGKFRDTSTTLNTTQSSSAAPAVTGEHVHHHGKSSKFLISTLLLNSEQYMRQCSQ